jgi:ubiquinone/menaquinone biosynthesis C-methylase UbiE
VKIEDSGMPEEAYWNSLFNIQAIVDWLSIPDKSRIVEIGCGYGTFTVPVAEVSHNNTVIAFDIEPDMIETTRRHLARHGLSNVECVLRDVLDEGTGLESESVDLVLLFNILHFKERRVLLQEASRILRSGGIAAIIHWRKDISTPRGPVAELRPDMAEIINASEGLELKFQGNSKLLEPYHWGIQLVKGPKYENRDHH